MEPSSDTTDRLKNYYHKMADLHTKSKNYKSAYVYYSEAAEKYFEASKLAIRKELVDDLKEK